MFGLYTGVLAPTAATNANGKNVRDALADGGGVLVPNAVYGKVNPDGTIAFLDATGAASATPVTNTTYADANTFYYDTYGKTELSVFDGSFTKLREVSLGYTFDKIGFLNKGIYYLYKNNGFGSFIRTFLILTLRLVIVLVILVLVQNRTLFLQPDLMVSI